MNFILITLSITAIALLLTAAYWIKTCNPFYKFMKIFIALLLSSFIIIAIYVTITMYIRIY